MCIRNKERACDRCGIISTRIDLPGSSNLEEILEVVSTLNSDSNIHGILVQSPAPDGVDELAIASSILPQKGCGRIQSRQSWKTSTGASWRANALYSVGSNENAQV